MNGMIRYILDASIGGACLITLILILRIICRRIPATFRCVLWMLVEIRLIMPYPVAGPFGLLPVQGFFYQDEMERSLLAKGSYSTEYGTYPYDAAMYDHSADISSKYAESDAENDMGNTSDNDGEVNTFIHNIKLLQNYLQIKDIETEDIILLIYGIGVIGVLSYMICGLIRTRTVTALAVARSYYIDGKQVKYYLCDGIETAFVSGLMLSKIYVPYSVTDDQLQYVLRHEFTHLRRHDYKVKFLYMLVTAFHWFNPIVWISYILLGRDIEEACDDAVVKCLDEDGKIQYADALLSVAAGAGYQAAFPVSFGAAPVKMRVEHVLCYKRPSLYVVALSAGLCSVLGIAFLTGHRGMKLSLEDEVQRVENVEVDPSGMERVQSDNYRLEPDDYNCCYDIYDRTDNFLGMFAYNAPLVMRTEDGKEVLFANDKRYAQYVPIQLDDELRDDIMQTMSEGVWHVWEQSDYVIRTDEATGLSYMMRGHERSSYGRIIFFTDADIEAYEKLSEKYNALFRLGMENTETVGGQGKEQDGASDAGNAKEQTAVGDIYAELEIKGLAFRGDTGFVYVSEQGVAYMDFQEASRSWEVAFAWERDEYGMVDAYLQANRKNLGGDITSFDTWKPIFDELSVDYDSEIDTDSAQYKAAMEELNGWGQFPPEYATDKQTEMIIRNHMKKYDEDGDRVINGIPGMLSNDVPVSERHVIIPIDEKYRQAIFNLTKQTFLNEFGITYDDYEHSAIFREYQLSIEKGNRLKGTWTLSQYEQQYKNAFVMAITEIMPDWDYGEEYDTSIVENITRADVEKHIVSDGSNLSYEQ